MIEACGHVFCHSCVKIWLVRENNHTCPSCQVVLFEQPMTPSHDDEVDENEETEITPSYDDEVDENERTEMSEAHDDEVDENEETEMSGELRNQDLHTDD